MPLMFGRARTFIGEASGSDLTTALIRYRAAAMGVGRQIQINHVEESRLVPGGTSDSVNAGGFDEQRATPVHEKPSDIAIASEHARSSAPIVVRTAVTAVTWRYAFTETSYLR
jgi:hypothetical protein